jgi:hypothetical protein
VSIRNKESGATYDDTWYSCTHNVGILKGYFSKIASALGNKKKTFLSFCRPHIMLRDLLTQKFVH